MTFHIFKIPSYGFQRLWETLFLNKNDSCWLNKNILKSFNV